MIAELGHAALWLAATLCLLQLVAGALAAWRAEQTVLAGIVRPAAIMQGALAGCRSWHCSCFSLPPTCR